MIRFQTINGSKSSFSARSTG
ncbi:protein of unknown function (plasmid) [Azospirillum baldaniorum]|uniref:Uncharacterized protein n=1 Tax=Azospirillum baldaniorum TaxID=1064539 RepID=A0A9P1JYG3_9PROT|nr:protein of unknown function [Azospirillum baldaniorum]